VSFLHRIAPPPLAARPAGACCGNCRHFCNEPFALEAATPGYAVLGSALGAVRAGDGQCLLHGRYVGARGGCPRFAVPQSVRPALQAPAAAPLLRRP
jgi:hypothetical protein